jgi:chemotaxis protein CheD
VSIRPNPPAIPMGAIGVAQGDSVLRTLLGSCLGLVLYDRRLRIGGLAHIVLPMAPAGRCDLPGKFVDTAVPALIRKMEQLADGPMSKLWAKIAGGANMFNTAAAKTIGEQNIEAVELVLQELRIPVIARHLGGESGRRMAVDTATGTVTIDVVGADTITM